MLYPAPRQSQILSSRRSGLGSACRKPILRPKRNRLQIAFQGSETGKDGRKKYFIGQLGVRPTSLQAALFEVGGADQLGVNVERAFPDCFRGQKI